jgi:hypothetical protein
LIGLIGYDGEDAGQGKELKGYHIADFMRFSASPSMWKFRGGSSAQLRSEEGDARSDHETAPVKLSSEVCGSKAICT